MNLTHEQLEQLETPCMVIDVEQTKRNIEAMQRTADACGCALRPHIKTHKIARFARMQVECGAKGITCAKVSEAEVMADGGLQDIFIAYPLVGDFRIRRAIALAARVKRLILAVDSEACASALNAAAEAAGIILEVRLEVDTGAKRTGIPREQAVELGKRIAAMPHLRLTGIYTFKSLVYHDEPTWDNALAAREEGEMMAETAQRLREAGIAIEDISAGSTPTGPAVAETGLVTEIRPGTYIFKDYMLTKEHAARMDEIAVRMFATVVSTPREDYAVIDGGTKTFPMDITPMAPPTNYPGYTVVAGRPDLHLTRMNEEHGMSASDKGKTGLRVGQKLELIPIHVCTALNMQNEVYLLEDGKLSRQRVEARGMLV
ncbi:MAG: alanine racemase [Aristaeellaceae bacterium]